jgi:ribosomal protein S18 acetylase RimI-like enzyme
VSGVVVRDARPDELEMAGRLVAEAYVAAGVLDADHVEYLEEIRAAARRAVHCPVLIAVEEGSGDILGSVTYVPGAGNPYAELEVEGEAGFRMLGVAPAAQHRGVAGALVRACIERARAAGRLGLAISTGDDMAPARRLYEGLGFRRAPERDFDPVPGVHLIAYTLAL